MKTTGMDTSEDDQEVVYRQQLKAAVHYVVGKVCEESGQDLGVKYQRQFVASLAEVTCKQIASFANDLELFSRHARRTKITPDDVKLLIRKSPSLHQHIEELQADIEASRGDTRKQSKKGKKKSNNDEDVDDDI